ncbi:MAG: hypothetical protein CME38_01225 [Haliea sp.]|nr:hypothetical protein [Haliea sp.]
MPQNEPTVEIRQFLGLRNTERPARMPAGSLVQARNIDIDDAGAIERRAGYQPVPGLSGVTAAYATKDDRRLFVVAGGALQEVVSLDPLATRHLAGGFGAGEVWWSEGGGYVFCSGAGRGVVSGSRFSTLEEFGDTSIEERALDAILLDESTDVGTSPPPPDTECVAFFQGSVWLSYYDSVENQSFLFWSKPFFWSRWDLGKDYMPVPGRVLLLAIFNEGLFIGTDQGMWFYTEGLLQRVADHGVVPGQPSYDQGKLYFWTPRGLCRFLPLEYLTEKAVSLPPGTRASVGVVRERGYRRAIVLTTGESEADNPYE